MDPELARLIAQDTPKLNPVLARGYARTVLDGKSGNNHGVYEYVDKLVRIAAQSFPEGLEYTGWSLATPEEDYEYQSRLQHVRGLHKDAHKDSRLKTERGKKRVPVRLFELARSDVVLTQWHFRWKGQAFTRFLFLPFVGEAGQLYLNGVPYFASPVLMDEIVSYRKDHLFIRLMKTRFRVRRIRVAFKANFHLERVSVHHTKLFHNKEEGVHPAVRGVTSLVHYLFAKYGVRGTFLKVAQCTPVIGGSEINERTYPPEEWVVCTSTGVAPPGIKQKTFQPTSIRLAVRQSEFTFLTRKLIGAFFYLADLFSNRLKAEYVDQVRVWQLYLGLLTYSTAGGEGHLQETMARHMQWLEEYIDPLSGEKLKHMGTWPTENIFDLLAFIVENYDLWWITNKAPGPTMYGKHLEVLHYLLSDVLQGINNVVFELRRPQRKRADLQRIQKAFQRHLNPYKFFSARKGHAELRTEGLPGDNMATKLTSKIVQQDRYPPPQKLNEQQQAAATNFHELLHASVAEVAQYLNLSSSAPDGRNHINLCLEVDEQGFVKPNPRYKEMIEEAQWHLHEKGPISRDILAEPDDS